MCATRMARRSCPVRRPRPANSCAPTRPGAGQISSERRVRGLSQGRSRARQGHLCEASQLDLLPGVSRISACQGGAEQSASPGLSVTKTRAHHPVGENWLKGHTRLEHATFLITEFSTHARQGKRYGDTSTRDGEHPPHSLACHQAASAASHCPASASIPLVRAAYAGDEWSADADFRPCGIWQDYPALGLSDPQRNAGGMALA